MTIELTALQNADLVLALMTGPAPMSFLHGKASTANCPYVRANDCADSLDGDDVNADRGKKTFADGCWFANRRRLIFELEALDEM